MKKNIKQAGFTLIELLVVISVIGLISSGILVSLNSARQKSRDAKRLADVRQIINALELYYADNFAYPDQDYAGGEPIITSMGYAFKPDDEELDLEIVDVDPSLSVAGEVLSTAIPPLALFPGSHPTEWRNYLGFWPIAPTPPDGGCDLGPATDILESTNQYTYWGRSRYDTSSVLDNPQSYQVTFCLGGPAGGLPAGQLKATPTGIVPN